jgi:hypothetical protein
MEQDMGLILRAIEAYKVHPLPIVKAYADNIGLVAVITELVPSEMEVDPARDGPTIPDLAGDHGHGHRRVRTVHKTVLPPLRLVIASPPIS